MGESVLFAARFRECAARSLFMPRSDPGRRVPLWQQRLRAAQLLQAARMVKNFPLLLETARECLQDVYDMPALNEVMTGLQAGTITVKDVETEPPSPFAENILFGFVGVVMYQYDQPQAERSAQLLSLDPHVLERLLGTTDMAQVLNPDVIREVEQELGERTFWNELADDDVTGRVTRYAKTHGPFTADQLMADLHLDATDAVHTLDVLAAKGELLQGVQVHIMDFGKAPLSDLQFLVMQEVAALYPDRAVFDHADKGRFNMFDKVSGSRQIRERFSKRNRWEDIRDYWYKDAEDFRKLSKKYYLYK